MKRKIIAIIMVLSLLFTAVEAQASEVIGEGLSDLGLAAKHYYLTNILEGDMTITRPDAQSYEITCLTDSGKLYLLTLNLKAWGTWNLGDMCFYDMGVKNTIIGGDTDWEYVFRVFNGITMLSEFTGGNHGSEELSSISFYDGVSGEPILLGIGDSKSARRIVVSEETKLLINSNSALPYANVTRKYTIAKTTVSLDTKVEFVRDVMMTLSYTAMASVNKSFGKFCSFDSKKYGSTSDKGSVTSAYIGETDAMLCTLSGENTSATLDVGIFNKADMTDNFSNDVKTFLWDMTAEYSKLYFSKYKTNALETVTKGTVWNLSTYWQANIK